MSFSEIYIDGEIKKTSETYKGENFFRKMFYYSNPVKSLELAVVKAETSIVEILMKNPHPNIVTFFRINEHFVDMEKLNVLTQLNDAVIEIMTNVKDFLQNLGIVYIDWKIGNIGKDKYGCYKLFDFDASGIFKKNTNHWLVKPVEFFNYKQARIKGYDTPKEIDNYAFELFKNSK